MSADQSSENKRMSNKQQNSKDHTAADRKHLYKQSWVNIKSKNSEAELPWPKLSFDNDNDNDYKINKTYRNYLKDNTEHGVSIVEKRCEQKTVVNEAILAMRDYKSRIANERNSSTNNYSATRNDVKSCSFKNPIDTSTSVFDEKCNNYSNGNDKCKSESVLPLWKINKLQAKEEKRRKREEEIRRQLISPKSEHFKMIDGEFKRFIDSGAIPKNFNGSRGVKKTDSLKKNNTPPVGSEFQLKRVLSEFPVLHSNSKLERDYRTSNMQQNFSSTEVLQDFSGGARIRNSSPFGETAVNKSNEITTKHLHLNDDLNICNNSKVNFKKKIRKDAPIEIDLCSVLQCLRAKPKKLRNGRTKLTTELVRSTRRTLCGNKLDSANPIRKKGKFRENKKKKFSKLKRCIINERKIRNDLLSEAKADFENNHRLVTTGLDESAIYHLAKDRKCDSPCGSEPVKHSANNTCDKNTHEKPVINFDPKILMHSRKFRPYCDQWSDEEMLKSVQDLIKEVVRFQDRHYINEPIKAHAKRRYVCGFHEVMKFLAINKAKLIIIATDIDCGNSNGGGGSSLMKCVTQMVTSAESLDVPYVYSGTRWSLRNAFKKKRPIACAAILKYEGAEELYKNVIALLPRVKNLYIEKLQMTESICGVQDRPKEDVTDACIKSLLSRLTVDDCDDSSTGVNVSKESPFMKAIKKCSAK